MDGGRPLRDWVQSGAGTHHWCRVMLKVYLNQLQQSSMDVESVINRPCVDARTPRIVSEVWVPGWSWEMECDLAIRP